MRLTEEQMIQSRIEMVVDAALEEQMDWVIGRIDKRISELELVNDLATQTITNAKLKTLRALRKDLTK